MPLTPGQLLHQRYRIERQIGQGGFATVYRAWDQVLSRHCAIKENRESSPQAEEQFRQEALLLARLHHPHLPRVIDRFGFAGQPQYLVMDFIDGQNLQQILRSRAEPLPAAAALGIIEQVCDALEYLHSQEPPIIHRDIKPQNVIITPEGRVVLVDFGIAKLYRDDARTQRGADAFTAGFAAPEQHALQPTDVRSDVYAVGATLYTLLANRRPPDARDRWSQQIPLLRLTTLNPTVSATVEAAIYKALDLSADRRYPTIRAFRRGLRGEDLPGWSRRRRLLTTILFLFLLGVTGWVFGPGRIGGSLAGWIGPESGTMALVDRRTSGTLRPTFTPTAVVRVTPTAIVTMQPVALVITVTQESPSPTPQLTDTPTPAPPTPTPPGGGGRVAFTSERDGNQEIYVMAADGSNLVNLTNHPGPDRVFSWSPDGQFLAFEAEREGNWDIYRMRSDGSDLSRLTTDPAEEHTPRWSPDGAQILYHSNVGDGAWRLWLMGADGREPFPLTNDAAGDWAGTWSPDGGQIAFAHNFQGPAEILILNRGDGSQVNLTNSQAHESAPVWSPDGRAIAFYSERDGNREIYLMNADGSGQTRLTSHPAKDYLPGWSPDSQLLLFTSDRSGNEEIYLMNRAGGEIRQLTDNPANDYNPVWSLP